MYVFSKVNGERQPVLKLGSDATRRCLCVSRVRSIYGTHVSLSPSHIGQWYIFGEGLEDSYPLTVEADGDGG